VIKVGTGDCIFDCQKLQFSIAKHIRIRKKEENLMFRKISIILLSVILIFNLGAASFAQEFEESEVLKLPERSVGEMIEIPLGEAKYFENRSGELIDVTDLLSFDTEDEANAYVEMIKAELNNPAQHKTDSLIVPMSTNGEVKSILVCKFLGYHFVVKHPA
jgi:hypothetical protein